MSGAVRSPGQLRSPHATMPGGQHIQGTVPEQPPGQPGTDTAPPCQTFGNDGDGYDVHFVPVAQRFHPRRRAASETPTSTNSPRYDRGPGCSLYTGFTITSWTLCIVGVAAIVLHALLLLLPFITTGTPASTAKLTAPASAKTSSTVPSPSTSRIAFTIQSTPFTNTEVSTVPQVNCTQQSPDVPGSDDMRGVYHCPYPEIPKRPGYFRQPVYCLYNVSRFKRTGGHGFLPLDLPLSLCQGVVYWSWRLHGGKLTSRAKEFDELLGLTGVRKVTQSQRYSATVLLTLGGYREDSADFHKLARDIALRQRLIQNVYTTCQRYSLDGINLHWVRGDDSCEDTFGSNAPRLTEFVRKLKWLVALNGRNDLFTVSAMVNPQDSFEMEFFRALRNDLNLTFFRTHHLGPVSSFDEYCESSALALESQLDVIKPHFPPPPLPSRVPATNTGQYKGLCISFSLALHARLGYRLEVPAPPRPISATPGYIAMFEVCETKLVFDEWRIPIPGCIVKKSRGLLLNVTFAIEGTKLLAKKMSMLGQASEMCVLLYDVDFDNYLRSCAGTTERYLMLQHFYSARWPECSGPQFNLVEHLP